MIFLNLAIWLPILAGVVLLALGRDDNARAVRWMSLVFALASFLVTIPLITGFDTTQAGMQFATDLTWVERFNAHYHVAVDGILWRGHTGDRIQRSAVEYSGVADIAGRKRTPGPAN